MTPKQPNVLKRWMITRLEIGAVLTIVLVVIGGLYFSIQDAVQLEQALNLNLTQNFTVSQGIVNLQREVLLTHNEILRLLGHLDNPGKTLTRFHFIKIQVDNLALEVASPETRPVFPPESSALVQTIVEQFAQFTQSVSAWRQATTVEQQQAILKALQDQSEMLEATVKQLIDRQSTAQREAIIATKDSLSTSQRTTILIGTVLVLMSVLLAGVVRQIFSGRLKQVVAADQLKSQLLSTVSHELRTPLSSIKGYSELLIEGAYGAVTNEQKGVIQRILLNTSQLHSMVNNLLDRAQIEQGKLALRNALFAPADLLETTQAALSILAQTKGVELKSEIAPDVPAKLMGDALRLQQILFNLTSNALKFTERGSVTARIFKPEAARWALQVSDTGIGIALEAQAHIFESFWQVDSSATRQYRGSGLGLAIVKQLVDLMHGEIALTSQIGQGSTFTVILPLESNV
jgi:signal transduction histidine kinase